MRVLDFIIIKVGPDPEVFKAFDFFSELCSRRYRLSYLMEISACSIISSEYLA